MNEKEIAENKTGIRKLKNSVNYFLESSSENVLIEDYIMESANKLLEELREAQKKKVDLIVWLLTFFILLLFSLIFYLFFTFETPIIFRVGFHGQWIRLSPFVSF